jgi:hypothetical protein
MSIILGTNNIVNEL